MPENLTQILSNNYYGNTMSQWVTSFLVVLISVIFAKIFYRALSKVGRKFVGKTETRIDDILFDVLEEPLGLLLGLFGARFGVSLLTLPDTFQSAVDNTFYCLFVFNAAWFFDRVVNALFEEFVVPLTQKTETDLDDQILPIARRGVRAIIWAVAIIVGINNAGYDVGAVLAGLGIGGLAFALAAQDTVSNLFGGITIFVDKPFKLNDRVKVHGLDGVIIEIGTRSSRLRTLEGRIVTIPNSSFTDKPVENVSSEPNRKVPVDIGLTYDMSADQVKDAIATLKGIAAANSNLEEKVICFFDSFGDFALNIKFIYYIKKESEIVDVMTDINLEILSKFSAKGLEMAFPTQTLHNIHSNAQAAIKVA